LSLMQGGSAISKDLPPFTIARRGSNALGGLNSIGLRRAGMAAAERLELRRLYHMLFGGDLNLGAALAQARARFESPAARIFFEFVQQSKRGICTPKGRDSDEEQEGSAAS
jgi:UDP-N-acetylglucosamine acyltransferase